MWTFKISALPTGNGSHYSVEFDSRAATFDDVVRAWRFEAEFRSMFNAELASSPLEAFRWEAPPVASATVSNPFEFVLLGSSELARPPDHAAFHSHFHSASHGATVFSNLGGDAMLVVPTPIGASECYTHLAAFVRRAPPSQQDALWRAVGQAMSERINRNPVWLNTAGAGVPWLHIQLDDRPKYYRFAPYRDPSSGR